MKIGCLILNYNDGTTTRKLLERIKNYSVLSKILVVDNCSTDQSFRDLKQYAEHDFTEKVHVIKSEKNGGYGYGNNIGVQYLYDKLDMDYILLCNPDVEIEEMCIRKLAGMFTEFPNCSMTAPIQLNTKGDRIKEQAWRIPTVFEYIITAGTICAKFFSGFYYKESYFNNGLHYSKTDCIPGSLFMVDASKFIQCGGYDPEMFLYCEETALGFKMKTCGYDAYLIKNCEYIHHHSLSIDKSIPNAVNKKKILLKSRTIFLRKYLKIGIICRVLTKIIYTLAIAEEYVKGLIINGRNNKC